MPEKNAPTSKARAIRDYLAEHPDTPPRAVVEALADQGLQVSPAFVSTVKAAMESKTPSSGSMDDLLVNLGRTQVDAMFRRQDEYPVDDFEFLPLVEAVLTGFEMTGIGPDVAEAVWEHAFHVYDQACKEAVPESTTASNRRLMQVYLLKRHPRSP